MKQLPTPCKLQKQSHDHVLTKRECTCRDTFQTVVGYILDNPVKGKLVERFEDWEFLGALVPGYPDLHPCDENFWGVFWKVFEKIRVEGES